MRSVWARSPPGCWHSGPAARRLRQPRPQPIDGHPPTRPSWCMGWLYALGGEVAFYAITAGVILIPGWRGSPVEMPGGETIFLPPTPEPPRNRWQITIERR
jgi:hypothetical protein